MTVKRLISLLQQCDPGAAVFVTDTGGYGSTSIVNVGRTGPHDPVPQVFIASKLVGYEVKVSKQNPSDLAGQQFSWMERKRHRLIQAG